MDNISFAKNMGSWSQDQLPVGTKLIVVNTAQQSIEKDLSDERFQLSLEDEIDNVDLIMTSIGALYAIKAKKELYDAKIHLSMVKHLLKSIR